MVSGSLALLYFLLGLHGRRQGSGPDRGRFSIRPSVRPYVSPPRPTSRQKASNGQRFPCPALISFLVFMGGRRAAAPIGDKVL